MAKFSPQYNPHRVTAQIRSLIEWTFWLIFILSVLPIIFKGIDDFEVLKEILNIVNIISILLFFTLEIIVEFILFPQSEQKRRDDFIDNSLGSKFSAANSIEYYDNDELSEGLYKAAVNLFENVFFTYSQIKDLTFKKIIFPTIVLIGVFVLAFFGFKEVPISLSILQVLFSANVLGNITKHLILLNKLSCIQDNWVNVFQHEDFRNNANKYQASIYRYWLQYESVLSRFQPGIPEKTFKRMNPTLTVQWDKIKIQYSIQ